MNVYRILLVLACTLTIVGCDQAPDTPAERTLDLIKEWVSGEYNNVAQAEADLTAMVSPELSHRPMYQLFAQVDVPSLDGYIVYQQSSLDGSTSPGMIFRHGLMQYFTDPDSGLVRQRELYFKDTKNFKNAHLNPEILKPITLDDMTWDPGCDFHLETNESGTMVSGPIIANSCVVYNQGLQTNMYADDLVEITASEYRFRGRFVDEAGTVVWGTESDELNKLIRQN